MEGMPNRRQRREMAKQAGYMKKKKFASTKEQNEMRARSAELGRKIHLANTERILRAREDSVRNKEKAKIEQYVKDGYTYEEALKLLEKDGTND